MEATPTPSAPVGDRPVGARPVRSGLVAAVFGIAAVVVLLDQLAKAWAVRALGDGSSIEAVGPLV
jgi:hypothetical protein